MADQFSFQIHGPGIASHPNGPTLNINITCDNYYHDANKHVGLTITSGYLVGGVASYPIDVVAWLTIGQATNQSYCRSLLFSRTSYSNTQINLSSPITLDAPNLYDDPVYLVIGVMSICTCSTTATTDAIVNSRDISSKIPRIKPYFWRMQYDKDPSVSTGTLGWHLARPFYICKTINGVKGWCSCEDETTLVYDANGNKIN